jgi:hypothetical protein
MHALTHTDAFLKKRKKESLFEAHAGHGLFAANSSSKSSSIKRQNVLQA